MSPSIERPRANSHEFGRTSEPLQAEHNATATFLLPNRQEVGNRPHFVQGNHLGVAPLQMARQESPQARESRPTSVAGNSRSAWQGQEQMGAGRCPQGDPLERRENTCTSRNEEPRSRSSGRAEEVPGAQQQSQAESLSELVKTLMRFTEAQSCAAKPPEKFVETHKSNIRTWLDAMETYLQAKEVPAERWPATILTFLSEQALTKVRRTRILETANSYQEFRKNLSSILGKPEDQESTRVLLDHIRQQPSEAVGDYASKVLELVVKAWGDAPPSTQTDMAIHHFVSGLWDGPTRDALRQQCTLFNLTWPEVIRFAQSREADPATQ